MKKRDLFKDLDFFLHPLPMISVGMMFLNDHYLKFLFHNWWTGKLSDFLGLFYFPLFLGAVLVLVRNRPLKSLDVLILIGSTHLGFFLLKMSYSFNLMATQVYSSIGLHSKFVMDQTDLVAHIMMVLTWLWMRKFLKKRL